MRFALIAICLLIGGWLVSSWDSALESREKAELSARSRDKRYEALFEFIKYGMTPWDIEHRIGWSGTEATGAGWPRTVRDVPDLEPIFVERELARHRNDPAKARSLEEVISVPTDELLHWIVWRVEGPVKYIAIGCVKRKNEHFVVARMYGLSDAAEPAVPISALPR